MSPTAFHPFFSISVSPSLISEALLGGEGGRKKILYSTLSKNGDIQQTKGGCMCVHVCKVLCKKPTLIGGTDLKVL